MLPSGVRKGTSQSLLGRQRSLLTCGRARCLRAYHKGRMRGVEMELTMGLFPFRGVLAGNLVSVFRMKSATMRQDDASAIDVAPPHQPS
jgi:hypothetical protein